jgi:phosphopantothenoylcysteine decarboxylase / phosphopantothenate---cysteine ligase
MARVVLGVSGGIAAYKACELCRLLVQEGHDVTPLLTPDAETFVSAKTFESLARKEMPRDLYPHLIDADLLVIAPLTANTLAKLAQGLADNVLTQAALAFRGPVLAAPAMNVRMWEHPATQANVGLLAERGVELIGPEEGELAEGETGLGRMSEPDGIMARCRVLLGDARPLAGKQVLVSAGGTREPLDAVRYLGNRSSGRMGVALAEEARRRGADVTLLAANLAVQPPTGVTVVETATAGELAEEALSRSGIDVVLMAAAVADYRPTDPRTDKRSKETSSWSIELEPTEDVLAELGRRRSSGQVLVGFAADHGADGLERARAKLAAKAVDLVVFNDVSRDDIGFDTAENEVVILANGSERVVAKADKSRIAEEILDEVERLLT